MIRLGVNIDHVATLRQARRDGFPEPLEAARVVMNAGADGVVVHLREDRRHIQDADVFAIRKEVTRLDLEMAATSEMVAIAKQLKPTYATLVPERREEITTEGGLDVVRQKESLRHVIAELQEAGIQVSLFVDPIFDQIDASAEAGAALIELHTGAYANAAPGDPRARELNSLREAAKFAAQRGLHVNAGHGLTLENVGLVIQIPAMEELNIGFSIIARALFVGLSSAVSEMKQAISAEVKIDS